MRSVTRIVLTTGAVLIGESTRRLVGVAAQGMTACPCAQQLVAGRSRERLVEVRDGEGDVVGVNGGAGLGDVAPRRRGEVAAAWLLQQLVSALEGAPPQLGVGSQVGRELYFLM